MSATTPVTEAGAPLIVLTYAHAGADQLSRLLSASSSLVCTSGTGLLPVCHEALGTWRQAEHGSRPSTLAIKSVRSLATSVITVLLAADGASRWCETTLAGAAAARSFRQIFPATTFLCLHRSLSGIAAEAVRSYPWGLGGSPFWPYASPNPGNNVATVAAYWAAHTQDLLDFEEQYPESCQRCRYEDLAAESADGIGQVLAVLGVPAGQVGLPQQPTRPPGSQPDRGEPGAALPAALIPPRLLAEVRKLHDALGYEFSTD